MKPTTVFFALVVLASAGAAQAEPTYLQSLTQQAHEKGLAAQRPWHLLLHYRRNIWGFYGSDIDEKSFFLDPHGRRDPSAELDATLKAFFDPPPTDAAAQHPQCRFPARYAWLKEQLGFDPQRLPEQACPRFEKWRDQMNAESVSMVFASYYMNNPASMYGHTFLLLHGKGHTDVDRLLDYTVNYAADVNTYNGILFAVYGLTGGYRGVFSTIPYYMKTQEYNNMESRDLWEYPLSIKPEGVHRMIQHLWELGKTPKAYYFLNKNCAYELLPVLEVGDPSLHMSDSFWLKAIPMDTVRVLLRQPGLVTDVHMRPSHVTRLLRERSQLTKPEIHLVETLAVRAENPPAELAGLPAARQALVLDTAYDLFRYRTGFAREQPDQVKEQDHRLLALRNQTGPVTNSAPLFESMPLSPDHGHQTGRIGLSYGFTNRSHFEELSLRPAVHDQDDPPTGYIPGSQLQMFHLRLRFDDDRKTLYVQQFTLVDLKSFSPWDRWVHHPSWKVNTGFDVANDLNRDSENSLFYGLNGGSGFAFRTPLSKRSMIYALAVADSGLGPAFRDYYRLGGGATGGLFVDIADFWRVHFNAEYLNYPVGEPGSATKLQIIQGCPLGHRLEFRAKLERQNTYKEVLFSLLLFL